MDRLAAKFIEAHPNNQYTSSFPLQPFINQATDVSYDDPRRYIYTTIGDMAKDTKALSYLYAPPACPDVFTPTPARKAAKPSGGNSITMPNNAPLARDSASTKKVPIVLFENVSCTPASYQIDVFTSTAKDLTPDPVKNAAFIGRVTRLGMGPSGKTNQDRCNKPTVTRILDASGVAEELKGCAVGIRHVVTDLSTGKEVSKEEWEGLGGGYEGRVVWINQRV